MNNRIALLLKVKDVTASKFAEMIGVQPSNISHILSGRNKPSLDFVIKVCEAFPDINIDWLMFGKGIMFKSETSNILNTFESEQEESNNKIGRTPDLYETPDLFSQAYLSDNSKIEGRSQNNSKNFAESGEKEIVQESNKMKMDLEELSSSIENVFLDNEKVENKYEYSNSEKQNKISEEIKTSHDIVQKSAVLIKPVRMVLIYADDTFELLNLKV